MKNSSLVSSELGVLTVGQFFGLGLILILAAGCGESRSKSEVSKAKPPKIADPAEIQRQYFEARTLLLKEEEEGRRLLGEYERVNAARKTAAEQRARAEYFRLNPELLSQDEVSFFAKNGIEKLLFVRAAEFGIDRKDKDYSMLTRALLIKSQTRFAEADNAAKLAGETYVAANANFPEWEAYREQKERTEKEKTRVSELEAKLKK